MASQRQNTIWLPPVYPQLLPWVNPRSPKSTLWSPLLYFLVTPRSPPVILGSPPVTPSNPRVTPKPPPVYHLVTPSLSSGHPQVNFRSPPVYPQVTSRSPQSTLWSPRVYPLVTPRGPPPIFLSGHPQSNLWSPLGLGSPLVTPSLPSLHPSENKTSIRNLKKIEKDSKIKMSKI